MRCAALIIVAAACASIVVAPVRAQVSAAPAYDEAPAALPAAAPTATPPNLVADLEPPRVPLARRWWFWASLGGAAVGVIAAGILLTPRDPYVGNAEPGGIVPVF